MNHTRRTLIGLGATATLLLSTNAWAQAYPAKPVSLIVPFAAGGPTDAVARIVARSLAKQSGQSFVVENVAGAGSTIGASRVARAAPDGYTLLWSSSGVMVIAPHLYPKLQYDPFTSFEPIGMAVSTPYLVLVNATSTIQSFDQLVAFGKTRPGKLNFGSPGEGTSPHLTIELMADGARFDATHVPYKGGAPAMSGLIGGEVDFVMDVPGAAIPMVKAGRVRPLAVTSAQRIAEFPDVPTLREKGLKDFESRAWFAMLAPRGTPEPVVAALRGMLSNAVRDPEVLPVIQQAGYDPATPSASQLMDTIRAEHDRWGRVIKAKSIRLQ